mgnify:CR=1 FL=1
MIDILWPVSPTTSKKEKEDSKQPTDKDTSTTTSQKEKEDSKKPTQDQSSTSTISLSNGDISFIPFDKMTEFFQKYM